MIEVQSITLNKSELNLKAGEWTYELKAMVTPANATCQDVCWSSSDPDIVFVNRQSGGICAVKEGKAVIRAMICDGTNRYAYCLVTVTTPISVRSVTIDSTDMFKLSGTKIRLTATIEPTNATFKDLSWTSSNTCVVAVHPVTGDIRCKSPGTAIITVTSVDTGVTDSIKITVDNKETVTVKEDEHSFYIEFMDGRIWRNIGVDLEMEVSGKHRFELCGDHIECEDDDPSMPNICLKVDRSIEEYRFMKNQLQIFSPEQLALAYVFDPLGVEFFMKNYMENGQTFDIPNRLSKADQVYSAIFGVKPKTFKINSSGDRYSYSPTMYEPRDRYFSDAEYMFGGHHIINEEKRIEITISMIVDLVKLFIPSSLWDEIVERLGVGVNYAIKMFFFNASVTDIVGDAVTSHIQNVVDEYKADVISNLSTVFGEQLEWAVNCIDTAKEFRENLDELFIAPNETDIIIYEKLSKNVNYKVLFLGGSDGLFIDEILELCSNN